MTEIVEPLNFAFDLDDLMLYATPQNLRRAADLLEQAVERDGQSADVTIGIFDALSGRDFAKGSLHLLVEDEWTGEEENDEEDYEEEDDEDSPDGDYESFLLPHQREKHESASKPETTTASPDSVL